MDSYGVIEFAGGNLSIVGLVLITLIETVFFLLAYGYSQEYPSRYKVPVFLLMFCSISTLFIFMLTSMGWWIYAT